MQLPLSKSFSLLLFLVLSSLLVVAQPTARIAMGGNVIVPGTTLTICKNSNLVLVDSSLNATGRFWRVSGQILSSPTLVTQTISFTSVRVDTVVLRADSNGIVRDSMRIFVNVTEPSSTFSFTNNNTCAGTSVVFTPAPVGNGPFTYSWNFGGATANPSTSTDVNPTVVFNPAVGSGTVNYSVSLVVTDANGCSSVIVSNPATVKQLPDASINDFNNIPPFIFCPLTPSPFLLQVDNTSSSSISNLTYKIRWGDGDSSIFGNSFLTASHNYLSRGNFSLQLGVDGINGCFATKAYNVFNGNIPDVSFGLSTTQYTGCVPSTVSFLIDTTSAGVGNNPNTTIYTVSFNDGSPPQVFSHPPPPVINKTFNSSSCGYSATVNGVTYNNTFSGTMVASNTCGSRPISTAQIFVSQKPIADFALNPDTSCQNNIVTITDFSPKGKVATNSGCDSTIRRLWSITPNSGYVITSGALGNPLSFNNNPANWGSHTLGVSFTHSGEYVIKLIVGNLIQSGVSVCGLDSITKTICIQPTPIPSFSFASTNGTYCFPDTLSFTNTSNTLTGCGSTSYIWSKQGTGGGAISFVGGTSSTSLNPRIYFPSAGNYTIRLSITNKCGTVNKDTIIVIKGTPSVVLPADISYCDSQTVVYSSANTTYNANGGIISSYNRSVSPVGAVFVNGTSSTDVYPAILFPVNTDSTAVIYKIINTITNECGIGKDSQIVTIQPKVGLPIVRDTFACGQTVLKLSATKGNNANTLRWYSDSTTLTVAHQDTTFNVGNVTASRSYFVSSYNTSTLCESPRVRLRIVINPIPGLPSVAGTTKCGSQSVSLNATPGVNGNKVKWYAAATGGPSLFTGSPYQTPVLTNTTTYYVSSFDSITGCESANRASLIVTINSLPIVSGSDTIFCNLPGSDTLTYIVSPTGASVTWSGTGVTPSGIFTPSIAGIGTHQLILVALNTLTGCKDSDTVSVSVIDATIPDGLDTTVCKNNGSFSLVATPPGGTWTGVRVTSGGVFTPDTAGTFKLVYSIGSGSCLARDTVLVTVNPLPTPAFVLSSSICPNQHLSLSSTNTSGIAQFRWKASNTKSYSNSIFADSSASTTLATFPENQNNDTALFSIRLILVNTNGCTDSIQHQIILNRRPDVLFSVPAVTCGPAALLATNTTASQATTTWVWSSAPSGVTFVNVNSSAPQVQFPQNTSSAAINYYIKLQATTTNGIGQNCSDADSVLRTVFPKPTVTFAASPNSGCTDLTTSFTNTSNPQNAELLNTMTFVWKVNNIAVSSAETLPNQIFINTQQQDSIYQVKLVGTTQHGCSDSITNPITVYPNSKAEFTSTLSTSCAPFLIDSNVISLVQYPNANGIYAWRILKGDRSTELGNSTGITEPSYSINIPTDSVIYQLITYSANGCQRDTFEQIFRTIANPQASFTMTDSIGCTDLVTKFKNTSTQGVSLNWIFSNGQSSILDSLGVKFVNSSHTVDQIYTAKLVITAGSGCKDSVSKQVLVYPRPQSRFSISNGTACPSQVLTTTNTSLAKAPGQSTWSVLNSTQVTLSNASANTPTVTLPDNQSNSDSTYSLKLRTTSVDGCIHDTTQTFTRLHRPNILFTVPVSSCGPYTFTPTNTTSNIPDANLNWLWSTQPDSAVSIATASEKSPTITLPLNLRMDSVLYSVKLIATRTDGNCLDTLEQPIVIYPKPQVDFTALPANGCTPLVVTFSNTSDMRNGEQQYTGTYTWLLNGTSISTDQTLPQDTFLNTRQNDSIVQIGLTGTSIHGCSSSLDKSLTIYPNPKSLFSSSINTSCAPFIIDNSVVSIQEYPNANDVYRWEILKGDKSSILQTTTGLAIPVFIISIPLDSVVYRLITTNIHNCEADTFEQVFRTIANPQASFTMKDSIGCADLVTKFKNTSTSGVSLNWTFGNGQSSTLDSLGMTFTNSSNTANQNYTAKLVITAGSGCKDSVSKTITVYPKPKAIFGIPTPICADTFKIPTNSSVYKGASINYGWRFTSVTQNSINDTTLAVPVFTFINNQGLSDSVYTVKLSLKSVDGCLHDTTQTVVVMRRPSANFSIPEPNCGPNTLTVTNNTTNIASTWNWSSALGLTITTNTSMEPSVLFPVNLTNDSILYQIKLTATRTGTSCVDTTSRVVTVYPKPQAVFTAVTQDSCGPRQVVFTNNSIAKNGEAALTLSNLWTIKGVVSIAKDTSVLFTNTGVIDSIYDARLVITSKHGCKDTLSKSIAVYPNPKSLFTSSINTSCAPFVIDNTKITLQQYSNANDVYRWEILRTDGSLIGTPSIGTTIPNHTIATPLDTVVYRLITTNVHNCRPDTFEQIFRTIANPQASFTISKDTGCTPLTVLFTNLSSPGTTNLWMFGNGISSTDLSPSNIYLNGSFMTDTVFVAKLIVTAGGTGCRDSISDTIRVYPKPQSRFGISNGTACPSQVLTTTNTSLAKAPGQSTWSVLNSTQVTLSNASANTPTVTLPDNQSNSDSTYSLKLRTTSVDGCIHDTTQTFTRLRRPNILFTVPVSSCGPYTFTPTNTTSNIPDANLNWLWSTQPDSAVSIATGFLKSPTITLPLNLRMDSVLYNVKLISTRTDGNCLDTLEQPIVIYPKPQVDFTALPANGCTPLVVTFSNTSDMRNGEQQNTGTYTWLLNGTSISTAQTLSQDTFLNIGQSDSIVNIGLIGMSAHGCKDTLDKNLKILPDAEAIFNYSKDLSCAPFEISASNIVAVEYPNANDVYRWYANQTLIGLGSVFPRYTIVNADDSVEIKLVVTSKNGCLADSMSVMFKTIPNPKPMFELNDDTACTPFNLVLNNTSTPPVGLSYIWTIGQFSSTLKHPSAILNNYGANDTIVYIKLVVTAGLTGCSDSTDTTVVVKPLPRPRFAFSDSAYCYPTPIEVRNTSIMPPTLSTSGYKWSVSGLGPMSIVNDSASIRTQIVYPDNQSGSARVYTVKLLVTSDFGCVDSIKHPVNIHSRPIADFNFQQQQFCSYQQTNTQNTSSYASIWLWKALSVNASIVSPLLQNTAVYGVNMSHVLDSIYNVRLIASNVYGCKDSIARPFNVNPKPETTITSDTTIGCSPLTIQFNNTTQSKTPNVYSWFFETGQTSSDPAPAHIFNGSILGDTSYKVQLITESVDGCKDTSEMLITAKATAAAKVSVTDTLYCMSNNRVVIPIQNHSYGSVDTFIYDFGDHTSLLTTSDSTVHHPYSVEGIYKVKLTAKNDCRVTIDSVVFKVLKTPEPVYTSNDSVGCAPLKIKFTNQTQSYEASYFWNFGNGQTSSVFNPDTVVFGPSKTTDTTYLVTLTAQNRCGVRSLRDTVRVLPLPVASFMISTDSGCSPLPVSFLNTTTGLPDFVKWTFGNGDSSKRFHPYSVTYRTEDTATIYKIKLVATNTCGIDSAVHQVLVQPNTVRAFFTTSGPTGCAPLTVKFFDYSVGGTKLSWNLGNGVTSMQQNPVTTYGTPGKYYAFQFVNNGCSYDTAVVVINVLKVPNFGITKSKTKACVNEPIQFTSELQDSGSIRWDFGDGDSSFLRNPIHQYKTFGPKTIKVTVISAETGCPKTITDGVIINPVPDIKVNLNNQQACLYQTFIFNNIGSTTDAFYTWTFGDDNSNTGASVAHKYLSPGWYSVLLSAENSFGCKSYDSVTVRAFPQPESKFDYSPKDTCTGPVLVKFTNQSIGATNYLWDFGNGLQTSISSPSITYSAVGAYPITLISGNSYNCFDTSEAIYHVYNVPQPNFSFTTDNGCEPLVVQFTNTSIYGSKLVWDFGDGTTSESLNPVHEYTDAGIYDVKLIVTEGGICSDSLIKSKAVEVFPKPEVGFDYNQTIADKPWHKINFSNQSTGGVSYLWHFGDGKMSSQKDPINAFPSHGRYTTLLIVTTDNGCKDSMYLDVDVQEYKKGLFVPNAFTPDYGSDKVRVFKPAGIELIEYRIKVFNKWGELVWESDKLSPEGEPLEWWDGLDRKGNPCPQGAYVWVVEKAVFTDGQDWQGMIYPKGNQKPVTSGNVTLIR